MGVQRPEGQRNRIRRKSRIHLSSHCGARTLSDKPCRSQGSRTAATAVWRPFQGAPKGNKMSSSTGHTRLRLNLGCKAPSAVSPKTLTTAYSPVEPSKQRSAVAETDYDFANARSSSRSTAKNKSPRAAGGSGGSFSRQTLPGGPPPKRNEALSVLPSG